MPEVLSFELGATEVCQNTRGFVWAKVWSNVPGGDPHSQRHDLGRKTVDTDDHTQVIADVFNVIRENNWQYVVGFTVLKLCGTKHASRLERFASYAFAKPGEPAYKVHNITSRAGSEELCSLSVDYGNNFVGILHNVVDFPVTTAERESQSELQVVKAAALNDTHRGISLQTNVILRQSVMRIDGLPTPE